MFIFREINCSFVKQVIWHYTKKNPHTPLTRAPGRGRGCGLGGVCQEVAGEGVRPLDADRQEAAEEPEGVGGEGPMGDDGGVGNQGKRGEQRNPGEEEG